MTFVKTMVVAVSLAVVSCPVAAMAMEVPAGKSRLIVVAQNDAIAVAVAEVERARAAYRAALVEDSGGRRDRRVDRRALEAVNEAIRALNQARADAGLAPVDYTRELAQDRVFAAEQKVEAARAELRDAIATGRAEKRARRRLDDAHASLDEARSELGLPPAEREQDVALQEVEPPAPSEERPRLRELPEPPHGGIRELPEPPQPPRAQQPPPRQQPEETQRPQPPVASAEELPPVRPLPGFGRDGNRPVPRFGEAEPGERPTRLPSSEEAVEEGESIQAGEGRVIERRGGQITITHDDTDRFRRGGERVDVERNRNGYTTTTIERPNGIEVVTVRDQQGDIVQRYRRNPDGSIEILIGAGAEGGGRRASAPPPPPPPQRQRPVIDFHRTLPPLRIEIPRQDYIVESSRASDQQIRQALIGPPVEQVERAYSLEEIRRSSRIRDKVRRIDFDTVTFEFGSAVVPASQIPQMERVGNAIRYVIEQDPRQVFLIEGHTDAVGSELANLALSDRRAETVAEILTYYFGIPPENLVTQGYGEQFLKIPTLAAERENRRVAFRNITRLLQARGG